MSFLINRNSDKTLFIALINCYILSSKSPQTLENAKFIASEFALRLSLVLYPFPKQSNGLFLLRTLIRAKIRERKTRNIQEKLATQVFLVKNYNMK